MVLRGIRQWTIMPASDVDLVEINRWNEVEGIRQSPPVIYNRQRLWLVRKVGKHYQHIEIVWD